MKNDEKVDVLRFELNVARIAASSLCEKYANNHENDKAAVFDIIKTSLERYVVYCQELLTEGVQHDESMKEDAILGDREMNGWILCNERMPETPNPGVDGLWESNPVLVYGEAEYGDDDGYAYDVAIYIKDEETNEGDWGEAADYATNYLKNVIAWREIPKFTEEVQQDAE